MDFRSKTYMAACVGVGVGVGEAVAVGDGVGEDEGELEPPPLPQPEIRHTARKVKIIRISASKKSFFIK